MIPLDDATQEMKKACAEFVKNMGMVTTRHTSLDNPSFVWNVLALVEEHELYDEMRWQTVPDTGEVKFWVVCSDLFFWGSADGEDLTPGNLGALQQAIADVEAILPHHGWIYGPSLFCARMRGERPQGAAYPKNSKLWPLFDACGPERPTGFGNPFRPGEYTSRWYPFKARWWRLKHAIRKLWRRLWPH